MANGTVRAIFIAPEAGAPMEQVAEVQAHAGRGLEGDRYCAARGSFNKDREGTRQVTLINGVFFEATSFSFAESRRNVVTMGVELMWLIGREFRIGEALFRGVKYCDPCRRPSKLTGKGERFDEAFHDRGGLVAEIIEDGLIREGDDIVPPDKGY